MLRIILILAVFASAAPMLGIEGGRYVLGQISEFRKDQYLLDTHTGRVWQVIIAHDGRMGLQEVAFQKVEQSGDTTAISASSIPFAADSSVVLFGPAKQESPSPEKNDSVYVDTVYKAAPGQISGKWVGVGFFVFAVVAAALGITLASE